MCIDSVDIYSGKLLGWLLISLHAACSMYRQYRHTLDLAKVAFLAYQFLVGTFY